MRHRTGLCKEAAHAKALGAAVKMKGRGAGYVCVIFVVVREQTGYRIKEGTNNRRA